MGTYNERMLKLVEGDEVPVRLSGEDVLLRVAHLVATDLPAVPLDDPYHAVLRSLARPAARRPASPRSAP